MRSYACLERQIQTQQKLLWQVRDQVGNTAAADRRHLLTPAVRDEIDRVLQIHFER